MSNNTVPINAVSQAASIVNMACFFYTGDGSGSILCNIGFTPRRVKVYDMTDATTYEWVSGMAATDSIKVVTGGTTTVDTNSAVVSNSSLRTITTTGVYQPGSQGPGDGTLINQTVIADSPDPSIPQLTLGSVCNVNAKLYVVVADG
jgi:hypothetical protein